MYCRMLSRRVARQEIVFPTPILGMGGFNKLAKVIFGICGKTIDFQELW